MQYRPRRAAARRRQPLLKLAGAADERQALRILVGARPFADTDELRLRIAGAEDEIRAAFAELAAPAALEQLLLAAQRLGRRHQVVGLERERDDTEVAVESQRNAKLAERSSQLLARRGPQRDALPTGRPRGAQPQNSEGSRRPPRSRLPAVAGAATAIDQQHIVVAASKRSAC